MFSKAGYNGDTWELYLKFRSTGETRVYRHVAPEMGDEVLSAPSLGQYFNKNIKGNAGWEFETLGADPEEEPKPKPAAVPETGLTDEDLNLVFEDPKAKPQMHISEVGDFPVNIDTSGVINSGAIVEEKSTPFSNEVGFFAAAASFEQTAIQTLPPPPEILGAWTAPESAAEALDLLAERAGEIQAIIKANAETGQQALTVKVTSQESRIAASETLDRLVAKRDTTTKALDPFRKVLYDVYEETGSKVKAAVEPLKKGIEYVKFQILAWDQQVERQRQEALRKAREEAEAEARRKQEEESRRLTLAEVDNRLEQGDEAGAQTLFDQPIEAPRPTVQPVFIPPAAPKVEGQSTATSWKVDRDAVESDPTGGAYLTSITLLLRAVKDGSYPIEQAAPLLSWDFGKVDSLAKAMMSAFNVPGLSVKSVATLRVGGRKRK
ncbi:MAG: KTSC domain-containing protein [Terracidiphilus sp.]|jgi:hypothetical protein